MKKRLLGLIAVLMVAAAASLSIGVTTASAYETCSNLGDPAPFLGGGINQEASGNCTGKWIIIWNLQYEVSGSWFTAADGQFPTSGNGVDCPAGAGTGFVRCFSAGGHVQDWTSSIANLQPYCQYNFRDKITWITFTSTGAQTDYNATSAELTKSC